MRRLDQIIPSKTVAGAMIHVKSVTGTKLGWSLIFKTASTYGLKVYIK